MLFAPIARLQILALRRVVEAEPHWPATPFLSLAPLGDTTFSLASYYGRSGFEQNRNDA